MLVRLRSLEKEAYSLLPLGHHWKNDRVARETSLVNMKCQVKIVLCTCPDREDLGDKIRVIVALMKGNTENAQAAGALPNRVGSNRCQEKLNEMLNLVLGLNHPSDN